MNYLSMSDWHHYKSLALKWDQMPFIDVRKSSFSYLCQVARNTPLTRQEVNADYEAYKTRIAAENRPDEPLGKITIKQKDFLKLVKEAKKIAPTLKERRETAYGHKDYDQAMGSVKLIVTPKGLMAEVMTIAKAGHLAPERTAYAAPIQCEQPFEAILHLKTLLDLLPLIEGEITISYRWLINQVTLHYERSRTRLNTLRWL